MSNARTQRQAKVVGEVCLYGSSDAAGYIAHMGEGFSADTRTFGDGEPLAGLCLTEAMWLGIHEIRVARRARRAGGLVRVFAPDGRHEGLVEMNHPTCYGAIDWTPARAYAISAEAILAAASD